MLDLAFGLTATSRLGCQIVITEELDGLTCRLPAAPATCCSAELRSADDRRADSFPASGRAPPTATGAPIPGTNSCCAGARRSAGGRASAAIWCRITCSCCISRAPGAGDLQIRHALAEMRRAQSLVAATLDVEIGLHIEYCRGWGLSEAAMAAEPEALETIAYTRFVLDRGLAGDRLDLEVALAPCIIGYAEIARERIGRPGDQARRQPVPRMARNVCRRRVPGPGARGGGGARRAVCTARRRGALPGAGRLLRRPRPGSKPISGRWASPPPGS